MTPFCVKGLLEPDRFLCTVSYWNCHIVREDEDRYPLDQEDVINEISHTNMIQFCQYLYDDISQNIDEWVSFVSYSESNAAKRKKELMQQLEHLKKLISDKKDFFKSSYCLL